MFENILIVYSERLSNKHLEVVEKARKMLGKRKFITLHSDKLKEHDFKDIDLVITIGGDGTFIRAAGFLRETPVLGINAEPGLSEGFFTSIDEDEIEKLGEVLEGNFRTIKRQRAKVIKNNVELKELALNDVYIGSLNQFHTSRYVINFKGKSEEQRSSGVLVSTGSGSTAWYKSAGGEPFSFEEKKLKFLVREVYSGRLFNPEILKGEIKEGESLSVESKRNYGGILSLDSNITYDFNFGDCVEVLLSDKPLNVIVRE